MSIELNKQLVSAFLHYANKGDMESSLALLSKDLVWTDVGTSPFAGTYRGKDTVLSELVGPLFSRLKAGIFTTIEAMIAEGEHVVVQSSGKAETLEGVPYNNSYCHIFRIIDGKILEVVEYCDTALTGKVFGEKLES